MQCCQIEKDIFTILLPLGPGLQEGRRQETGVDLHQVQPEGPQVRGPGQPQTLQEALAIGK